ncbi:MAG: MATE family efflux transporter [Eubacteriales bacterium]|nr:MATE family efflux transporter [Eubacteriales bacterium]
MQFIQDMTHGSPLKLLVRFSLPMIIGNLFQQLYTMTDSIIVGKFIGADALASVGACNSVTYLLFSLCLGLSSGIGIVISQHFGSGNEKNIRKAIGNSIYLLLSCAIVLTVLGLLCAKPVMELLGTPKEIMGNAVSYFQIVTAGTIAVAFYNGISSILRALGDSRTPLFFLILAALLNIGLDLLFVLIFHMGVAGTALATTLAQLVSACSCLAFAIHTNPYFRLTKTCFAPDRELITQMLHIGLPLSLQNAMIALSCTVLQGIINTFGTTVVAAFTSTNRIESLIAQVFLSLNTALSSYTAQNLGAENPDRVRQGTRCSVGIVCVFSIIMLLFIYLFGKSVMGWFVQEPDVIQTGSRALKLISCFFAAWGLLYVFRGVLNGAGNAGFAYVSGLLEIIGRVGFALLFTRMDSVGVWGIWLAEGCTWILITVAGIYCYRRGNWKHSKLIRVSAGKYSLR